MFCSTEAAFHLNGLVNKHNVRHWSEKSPLLTIERVMQSPKVHVCCSMSESRVIIGPYFFDDDTINGQNSHSMLKEFCSRIEKITQSNLYNFSRGWSTISC